MNPKERAKSIIENHSDIHIAKGDYPSYFHQNMVKRHAIATVDVILELIDDKYQGFMDADLIAYWEEVKNEINKQ